MRESVRFTSLVTRLGVICGCAGCRSLLSCGLWRPWSSLLFTASPRGEAVAGPGGRRRLLTLVTMTVPHPKNMRQNGVDFPVALA